MNLNFSAHPDGQVYLIRYNRESIYKIGHTSGINLRLRRLQIQLPHSIELIARIYTSSPRWLEDYWHQKFASQRRLGSGIKRSSEWFDLNDDEVAEFIAHDGSTWNKPIEQEQAELPNLFTPTLREEKIKRIIDFYDELIDQNPRCVVSLINSCNFQLQKLNKQIYDLRQRGRSEDWIVNKWEEGARSAALAKIDKAR